jgi:hypothetical protein
VAFYLKAQAASPPTERRNRAGYGYVGAERKDSAEFPSDNADLHVFVWAILDLPEGLQFTLFDPTADDWADVPDLSGVDYALT